MNVFPFIRYVGRTKGDLRIAAYGRPSVDGNGSGTGYNRVFAIKFYDYRA